MLLTARAHQARCFSAEILGQQFGINPRRFTWDVPVLESVQEARQRQADYAHHEQNQQMKTHPASVPSALNSDAEPPFAAPTSFHHITLTTFHECAQVREDVPPEVAAQLSQLITTALANGGWTDLKSFGIDSAIHVSVHGTTLLAELHIPCKDPRAAKPAVRIGVCAEPSGGADTWRQLCSDLPMRGRAIFPNPPEDPWIGAVILNLLKLVDLDAKQREAYLLMEMWAGDFERCLAWGFVTWLESHVNRH